MLPPMVALRRTSPSATCEANCFRTPSAVSASVLTVTIAPMRTTPAAVVMRSRPLRWSSSAFCGRRAPSAISGRRIVPPPTTVMPAPSPKRRAASSAEVGISTSAATAARFCSRAVSTSNRVRAAPSALVYIGEVAFASIDELESALAHASYLPDRGLATALYLSQALEKPVLLEGEAGVGKTEAAKALATALGAPLIRLQCYEGLDVANAVYEWNYARQLLHIRAAQEGTLDEAELFGPAFLIRRPLLEAIDSERPVVLLIDEVDRADEEFEAFLLEVLSDFQITIPELGTITARRRPSVVLTSNRTRELHDALKRRCLYHWIGHPSLEREIEIVRLRVPDAPERLAAEAAAFVAGLRGLDLQKPPGLAETIDWARALAALGRQELDAEHVEATLGSLLKYHEDLLSVRDETLAGLVAAARDR
jgi:MoxR-like ATPase